MGKSELQEQVARVIGCNKSELSGEKVFDVLHDIDRGGVDVYWQYLEEFRNEIFE